MRLKSLDVLRLLLAASIPARPGGAGDLANASLQLEPSRSAIQLHGSVVGSRLIFSSISPPSSSEASSQCFR